MPIARIYGVCALVVLCCCSCTGMLSNTIRANGNPVNELSDNDRSIRGYYVKDIERSGVKYAVVLVHGTRARCNDNSSIRMLLPLSDNSAVIPQITETGPGDYSMTTGEKEVEIIFDNILLSDNLPRVLSKLEPWPGYPGKVFLYPDRENKHGDMGLAYRFGGKTDEFRIAPVRTDLKWICRKKSRQVLYSLGYPVTVALDVLASPLLILMTDAYFIAR